MASETGEKPEAFSTSLYVTDKAAYEECKRLLKLQGLSLSEEIMNFVLRRRDEMKGNGSTESSGDSTRRFEELKATHFQLGQKVDKFKTVLQEKKVYNAYIKKFGEILGYDASESSWTMDKCVNVIDSFMRHGADDGWKRAETRFLMSNKAGGGIVHTFLDYLESVRERKRVERKLLELRADPEELARLDELERQEEEQRKKDAETRKQKEAEEARKQKEEEKAEDPYEEPEEEEDDTGLLVFPSGSDRLTIDAEEEGAEEEGGE
jgi:hypothetical protein